jgi:hypothetical protein
VSLFATTTTIAAPALSEILTLGLPTPAG